MQRIYFNIRNAVVLQSILQEKFLHYFDHANYKLKGRYVLIHSMFLQDDPQFVFGKLLDVNPLHEVLQFHLQIEGFRGIQLVTLQPEDVLIIFEGDKDSNQFVPRFIYWDDKYLPEAGLNLKTLISVSRLDRFQLEKYLYHPNYMLDGRKCIVRSMAIDTVDKNVIGRFVGILNSGSEYLVIMVNYADGFMSSQKNIGRGNNNKDNDLVLIIFDKEGVSPEFIYWE